MPLEKRIVISDTTTARPDADRTDRTDQKIIHHSCFHYGRPVTGVEFVGGVRRCRGADGVPYRGRICRHPQRIPELRCELARPPSDSIGQFGVSVRFGVRHKRYVARRSSRFLTLASTSYRPDIDGLRALAVFPVVIFHAYSSLAPGGYIGVDVFFVVSGYLITRIIFGEIQEQRFSLVKFYERRARRILPALFAVIFACTIAGAFLLTPSMFENLTKSVFATTIFASNIYFWQTIDYFSTAAEFRPLLHTWSLAVEEQFYVFWPLFLILVAKLPKRYLTAAVTAILIVSFAGSVIATENYSRANFYSIPTRTWELMIGAILALEIISPWRHRGVREVSALGGIIMILVPALVYDSTTSFPGTAALWPCLGTALLIHSKGSTWIGRMLSQKHLVFAGLISYSLYLWHWPILAFLRIVYGTVKLPFGVALLAVAVSIGMAILSWRFIERPFRQRNLITRRLVFLGSGTGTVACLLVSLSVIAADGAPSRFSGPSLAVALGAMDVEKNRFSCRGKTRLEELCRIGDPQINGTVLFWGDSHAGALMSAVDVVLKSAKRAGYVTYRPACAPITDVRRIGYNWQDCTRFNNAVLELIESLRPKLDTVILAGRWALSATGNRAPGESGKDVRLVDMDGNPQLGNAVLFEHGLGRVVARLRLAGVRVVILSGVPEVGWDVPSAATSRLQLGLPLPNVPSLQDVRARNAEANAAIVRVTTKHNALYVPVAPLLCQPECQVLDRNGSFYVDDDHLSVHGARNILGRKLLGKVWAIR